MEENVVATGEKGTSSLQLQCNSSVKGKNPTRQGFLTPSKQARSRGKVR
jgi:hypothetical protein